MLGKPEFRKQVGKVLLAAFLLLSVLNTACWQFEAQALAGAEQAYASANRTPRWSADGTSIVVNVHDGIYRINSDGDELRRIPQKRDDGQYSPAVSSNGVIAYVSREVRRLEWWSANYFLETMSLEGDRIKQLAKGGGNPVWSPDGSQLAHFDLHETPQGLQQTIRLISHDGSRRTELGSMPLWRGDYITWHPNGRRIAVWSSNNAIATVEPESETWHIVAETKGPWSYLSPPAWSRSDGRLYYIGREPGIDSDDRPANMLLLYSANYDGTNRQTIADLGSDIDWISDFQISPTGHELLFVTFGRSETNRLYVISSDGSGLKNLISDAQYTSGGYRFGAAHEFSSCQSLLASWSPDGSQIAVHIQNPLSRIVLFTVAPDGSDPRTLITRDFTGNLVPRHGGPFHGDASRHIFSQEKRC